LKRNTEHFRSKMKAKGLPTLDGEHPIVPVMLGDAKMAGRIAERLLEKGVYVIAFSFPVVPKGKARIRTQISAAHSYEELEFAASAFQTVYDEITKGD